MMSLPSIQETVVLINSNFSSNDTLIKELFERFLAAKEAALESTISGVCLWVLARVEIHLSSFRC